MRRVWESLQMGARRLFAGRGVRIMTLGLVVLGLTFAVFLYAGYRRDRARLAREWTAKTDSWPRASAAVIRGRLEALIDLARTPGSVPSFLPESMADNVACSAAVSEAVNFLVGGSSRLLQTDDAWRFAWTNRAVLETTYDRVRDHPNDFTIENGRIVERYDRRIWLSELIGSVGRGNQLTSSAIFIVGYHYRETQSDEFILNSEHATWNSHVLLILGRRGGHWYGYHLFHDPHHPSDNPFRVDDLGDELPEQFDLMYVWRVRGGIDLTLDRVPQRVVSVTRPYVELTHLIGWANWTRSPRVASFVDSGIIGWFGDEEQFPQILDVRTPFQVITSPNLRRGWHGQLKGFLNGAPIRRQVGESRTGTYGREFQCVEFVNRYYSTVLGHRNMHITGNADSYFYDAASRDKGLVAFPNGGVTPPAVNDILVFDRDGPGVHTDPGHVGIVYEVTPTRICIAQQNTRNPSACLPVRAQEGHWFVSPLAPDRPCVGWSRRRESSNGPTNGPTNQLQPRVPRALASADRRGRW